MPLLRLCIKIGFSDQRSLVRGYGGYLFSVGGSQGIRFSIIGSAAAGVLTEAIVKQLVEER